MSGNNAETPLSHKMAKISSVQKRKATHIQNQEKKIGEDEFMAAAIGDVEWLKQSIRGNRGAVNYDKNGLTPLHLAAIHGRLECLKLMIDKFKVDINMPSKTGWRPVHLVISNQTGKRAYNCLSFLLEKGADPSVANDDGITPMHQAASEGHVQCLKALIEVGALPNGVDYRGHTPIDLAKLWGHRKCARLLAAEQWHQDKRSLAREMSQLQKLEMQKTLYEMQADEENSAHQKYYGDLAFSEWLQMHGLEPKPTGPKLSDKEDCSEAKASESGKEVANTAKGESLYTANSIQRPKHISRSNQPPSPIKEETESSTHTTSITPRIPPTGKVAPTVQSRDSTQSRISVQAPESGRETREMSPMSKAMLHFSDWNKSTKASQRPYIPMLEDFYPRDEYSMLPRPPPKRQLKSPTTQSKDNGKIAAVDLPSLHPVVYKCKHIADVHKKKHYDIEKLPRSEVGMHLSMDPNTRMFRSGLLVPLESGYLWKSHSGSRSRSANLQSMMVMLERMSNSSPYYSVEDLDYEVHDMYQKEVI
ncbi:hypothetical protein LSH36_29g01014 [Paralvinella palmiformis]|uniref:Ankyrin repeat domain-containing protein 53 n=1 Tax=Paralvinella palmiformis TaxID=53620 RepID=A0AAD9K976_9ANNE|nr:hypothetical protein LSH36_29g01014 [Paralvinella palmiformis]